VAVANVAVGLVLRGGVTLPLVATGVATALSLSVVSFDTMALMTFSSLQKQRAGANQPLGLALGGLLVFPAYLTAFILPGIVAVAVDLAEAVIIAALSIALFLLSSRLISREKLLP
jgi:putative flippase GtrA